MRRRAIVMLAVAVMAVSCAGGSFGDKDGEHAATSTTVASTTTMPGGLTPITGYGDYSDYDIVDVPWIEVTGLVHRCVNDHGYPVRLIPPGDGLDFQQVPLELNAAAAETADRCQAGLNLPEARRLTADEIRRLHRYWAEVTIPCLEALGHTVPELPSADYLVEHYYHDPYTPHEHASGAGEPAYAESLLACPPSPAMLSVSDDD